jgi:hypothetical protein
VYINVYIFLLQNVKTEDFEQNDNKHSPNSTWFNFFWNGILNR